MMKRLILITLVLSCISVHNTLSLASKSRTTFYISLLGLDPFTFADSSNRIEKARATTVIDPIIRHDRDYLIKTDRLWIIAYDFGGYEYALSPRIPDVLCLVDAVGATDFDDEQPNYIGARWATELIDLAAKGTDIFIFASTDFDFNPTCTRFTILSIDAYSSLEKYATDNGAVIKKTSDDTYIVKGVDGRSGSIRTYIMDMSSMEVYEQMLQKLEMFLNRK